MSHQRASLLVCVVLCLFSESALAFCWYPLGASADTPASFTYTPRCNHNSKDISNALVRREGLSLVQFSGKVPLPLKMRSKWFDACTRICSPRVRSTIGVDGTTELKCPWYTRNVFTGTVTRIISLADSVVQDFDGLVNVMHKNADGSSPYSISASQHQCFIESESKTVSFSSHSTNVQVVLTLAPPPKGDHWAGVSMWAVPCAWEQDTNRPIVIRLNVHPIAFRMSDSMVKRDMRHHLLHGLGLDGTGVTLTTRDTDSTLGATTKLMPLGSGSTVMASTYGCSAVSEAVPMDDELRLRSYYLEQDGTLLTAAMFLDVDTQYRFSRLPRSGSCNLDAEWSAQTSSSSCGTKASTDIYDDTRRSHFESRVVGRDDAMAAAWGDKLTALDQQALISTGKYLRPAGSVALATPDIAAGSPTCDLIDRKCDAPENRHLDAFCVPHSAMVNATTTCSASYDGIRTCEITQHPVSLDRVRLFERFKYFDSQFRGGASPADDFCPREVVGSNINCTTAGGPRHRCFDHMLTASGAAPTTTGKSACYEARCPFGTKVEFKFPGASSFITCANPGSSSVQSFSNGDFSGSIVCPKASDFCSPAINVMPPEPTWFIIPGTDIEYGVVPDVATREQALMACKSYGNGSTLAFIPSTASGAFVNARAREVITSGDLSLWVGVKKGRTWESTHGHTLASRASGFSRVTADDGCVKLINGALVVEENCNALTSVLCSRDPKQRWYDTPPPGLAAAGFGTPVAYKPLDLWNGLQIYAPITHAGERAGPAAKAKAQCTDDASNDRQGHLEFVNWRGDDATRRTTLRDVGSTVSLDSNTPGYWTSARYEQGDAQPWWADLVVDGLDAEPTEPLCFVLGRGSLSDSGRVLYPVECGVRFPTLCAMATVVIRGAKQTALKHEVALVLAWANVTEAKDLCGGVVGGDRPYSMAPISHSRVAWATRWWWLNRINVRGLGVTWNHARVAGSAVDGAMTWPDIFAPADSAAVKKAQYLPHVSTPDEAAVFTDGVRMTFNDDDNSLNFTGVPASERLPVLCGRPLDPSRGRDVTCGTNGTWCWDTRTDQELLYVESPQRSSEEVGAACAELGGFPVFEPPVPNRLGTVLPTLFGDNSRALRAFVAGMRYANGDGAGVVSNTTVPDIDLTDVSAFYQDNFESGMCFFGSLAKGSTEPYFAAHDCRRPGTYICRKPLAAKWVPYRNTSVNTGFDYEFTLTQSAVSRDEAIRTCHASDGTLAFFEFDSVKQEYDVGTVFAELGIDQPGDYWFGLDVPFDSLEDGRTPNWFEVLYQKTMFGIFANATADNKPQSDFTAAQRRCHTVNFTTEARGTHTERNCTEKYRALCVRSRQLATHTIPAEMYTGPSSVRAANEIRFTIPEGNSRSVATMEFNVTSNATGLELPLGGPDSAVQAGAECGTFTEPTYASFTFAVESSTASVRSTNTSYGESSPRVAVIWPCIAQTVVAPTAPVRGLLLGQNFTVAVRVDQLYRPGSFVDVRFASPAGLTCFWERNRFKFEAANSEFRFNCTSTTSSGATLQITNQVAGFSPAQIANYLLSQPLVTLPNAMFLHADAIELVNAGSAMLAGRVYVASLRLMHPSPVPLRVRMSVARAGFGIVINQTEWRSVTTQDPLEFTAQAIEPGTFDINVTLTLEDGEDAVAADLVRTLQYGTFGVGSLAFRQIHPVSVQAIVPKDSEGAERVYAAQRFDVVFVVRQQAFVDDAMSSITVGVDTHPIFTPVPGGSRTVTISQSTCTTVQDGFCRFTVPLMGVVNVSDVFDARPAGVNLATGEATQLLVPLTAATGTHTEILPVPSGPPEVPFVEFRLVKSLTVLDRPTLLFGGGPSYGVTLALPQTPAHDARVVVACERVALDLTQPGLLTTLVTAAPTAVDWPAQQWGDDEFDAQRIVELRSPGHALLTKERSINCTLSLSAASDVGMETTSFEVTVAPRAKMTFTGNLPDALLPGEASPVEVRIGLTKYAPLPETTPIVPTAGGYTMVVHPTIPVRYVNGLTEAVRTFLVTVNGDAPPTGSTCVRLNVSDTEHFEDAAPWCFAVLPKITVDLSFDEVFRQSQPVGPSSPQRFTVGLSSVPIGSTDVKLDLDCIRTDFSGAVAANVTIATFDPPHLTWRATSLRDAGNITRAAARQRVTVYGVVPGQLCRVGFRPVAVDTMGTVPAQLEGSTTVLTALYAESIIFANLLYASVAVRSIRDALYIGDATPGLVTVRLPSPPTALVLLRCVLEGASDASGTAAEVWPAEHNVTSDAAGVSERVFTIRGLQPKLDDVPMGFRVELVTTAGEYSSTIPNASRTFVVRRPIALRLSDAAGIAIGNSLTMYCGGDATAALVGVAIPHAPLNLQSPVQLRFGSNVTTLSVSPREQLFGSEAWSTGAQSATFSLSCSATVVNETTARWWIDLTAPAEFEPRRSLIVHQLPLVGYTVTSLFRYIYVGAVLPFAIRPNLVPPPGTTLRLRLTTSCGQKIRVFDNGLGLSIEWTGNVITRTIPLQGGGAVEDCTIGLVVDRTSTAAIFQYAALEHTVTVLPPPQIYVHVDDAGPRTVITDELGGGVSFKFRVRYATFHRLTHFVDPLRNKDSKACVLVESTGSTSDETTFAFAFGRSPRTVVTATADETGESMTLRVTASLTGQFVAERVMFTFTRHCFLTTDESPSIVDPNERNRNFSFEIEPPAEPLSVANNVVSSTALGLSVFSGSPTMGTAVAKMSFLQQTNCEAQKIGLWGDRELGYVENIFNVPVGPKEGLGVMLGAAVFNTVMLLGFALVHLFACFFIFVLRRDFAVGDKTFAKSAALLRFPCATAIPAMFFVPLACEFSLRVAMYSTVTGMRVTGAMLFGINLVAGVVTIVYFVVRAARRARFVEDVPDESRPMWTRIYRIRGKWRCEDENERNMYGYFYDDFMARTRFFNGMELFTTCCISVAAATEPKSRTGCIIKVGFICGLFGVTFGIILFMIPYRRHIANLFFGLIALVFLASSAVGLGALHGKENSTTKWASEVSVQIVGNLIVLKLLFDLFVVAYETFLRKHIDKLRKKEVAVKFKVTDEELTVPELYPTYHSPGMMEHEVAKRERDAAAGFDEMDDADEIERRLLGGDEGSFATTAGGHRPGDDAAREAIAREVERQKRNQEIMDQI